MRKCRKCFGQDCRTECSLAKKAVKSFNHSVFREHMTKEKHIRNSELTYWQVDCKTILMKVAEHLSRVTVVDVVVYAANVYVVTDVLNASKVHHKFQTHCCIGGKVKH